MTRRAIFFLIIFFTCFHAMHTLGQNNNEFYELKWKNVESLKEKGLVKSALDEVRIIYKKARKEKQEAQIIKAAVQMTHLQAGTREDHEILAIKELEAELSGNSEVVQSIFKSLIANAYLHYYQRVRWQLYRRTATTDLNKEDILTWGTEDFHKKITALYLESLENEKQLKETKVDRFDAILIKGNVRKLRPTLFDLLAHNALTYFCSDERYLKTPAQTFEIKAASAFDPAADFIHRKFETPDSTSLEFYALQLYQRLVAFHINDTESDALIDADLARLRYVRQKSTHEDADDLYYISIKHIAEQYRQTPAAAQAWYLVADYHFNRGEGYQESEDNNLQFEKVKAAEICERIIKENPETEGGINAFNLLQSIRKKVLQLDAELVVVPEKPFLMFVEYRNIARLHFRVVKASPLLTKALENRKSDEAWRMISKGTPLRSWTQTLPDTRDYQNHRVQIKAEALPVGEYLLLASSDPAFSVTHSIGGVRFLYVSNISFIQRERDFFVLHRDSGQPLAGAVAKIWEKIFNSNTRSYQPHLAATYHTDKNGYFKDNRRAKNGRYPTGSLDVSFENDKLHIPGSADTYYYDADENEIDIEPVTYLFTDRSLYRPGQTVFFKGIVAYGKSVLKDQTRKITIVLENANDEVVDSLVKTVNDFGSFSGSFILPINTLNGSFAISADDQHTVSFRVEEYKRPRFEVRLDTLRGSYKLGDTIRVTGTGAAYAGNTISGAKVAYRVVRGERSIFSRRGGRYLPTLPAREIAHGETVTDDKGQFEVSFEAVPGSKADKNPDKVFDFRVYADVTDLNGETRSAEVSISVGKKAISIKTEIPETISLGSFKSLKIRTENLNGKFIPTPVSIRIAGLTPENRLIRSRYWSRPDVFVMTKSAFIADFPNDEYDSESQMETWPEDTVVFEKTQPLTENEDFVFPEKILQAGFYKIAITARDRDEVISDTIYLEVTDPQSKKLARPEYAWAHSNPRIEPGEKADLQFGTSAEDAFVVSSSGKKYNPDNFSFFSLNNEKKDVQIIAREEDRGGYAVDYVFVKHNRVHQSQNFVNVPWTNKELKIDYQTFRNKTQPGSTEEWKIRISGYQKEQVAAEMLASMYDASLDQFSLHNWSVPDLWPSAEMLKRWEGEMNFNSRDAQINNFSFAADKAFNKQYDRLYDCIKSYPQAGKGGSGRGAPRRQRSLTGSLATFKKGIEVRKEEEVPEESMIAENPADLTEVVAVGYGSPKQASSSKENVSIRKNLKETAFFLPDLKTDQDGAIIFSFTVPEALTRWKFQALAHTKELAFGYSSKEIITQKELMVQPNAPRFFREGDTILFPVKIVNLSDKTLTGEANLKLTDPATSQDISDNFNTNASGQTFSVAAGGNSIVFFHLHIPKDYQRLLTWRVTAVAGNFSDGEENTLPVLPNRMLVVESLPIPTRANGMKDFRFEKLLNSQNSETLTHESVTVEYTGNPVWYAVQALPYLMEYPYECAEQTWNRYYANALASSIVKNSPKIAAVFNNWKLNNTDALISNLRKNEELKSLLLEETPWVLESKSETEQKRNIALLFDLVKMTGEMEINIRKLAEMQNPTGAFPWFKGGQDDRHITQYILTGIGRLRQKNAIPESTVLDNLIEKAFVYLDEAIAQDYNELSKRKANLKDYTPGPIQVQYLFMRSYFNNMPLKNESRKAQQYFSDRTKASWVSQSRLTQGQIALTFFRANDPIMPKAILKSLRENAIQHEEMGMYWKSNQSGRWYEAPIEQQSLLIEAFLEIEGDRNTVDNLKTWLLKNKQTNRWESTKATADACYALLMTGNNWLADQPLPAIQLGNQVLKLDGKTETGTGYFKETFKANEVNAEMGSIRIDAGQSKSTAPAWGAIYWQYFEDLDKISPSETPLKLSKKLFVERKTNSGLVLEPVDVLRPLKVGDKIVVRVELRVDRDLEYVHMKDARASAFEPVNVLSGYKWQGGLGYYETTKDASTNFFFDRLRKGTYVFEYPLFVNHQGDFSNGITSIQCMYAPEFSAHSEGVRIKVSDN